MKFTFNHAIPMNVYHHFFPFSVGAFNFHFASSLVKDFKAIKDICDLYV